MLIEKIQKKWSMKNSKKECLGRGADKSTHLYWVKNQIFSAIILLTDGQSKGIYMAIIVNKEEKRRAIALSCTELLLEYGIGNLTISEIAKTAGVGKGTIYEYFENKEDIVFEIIGIFMAKYEEMLLQIVGRAESTREKLFHFLFMIFEEVHYHKQLNIYREFLAISLANGTQQMVAFSVGCRERFAMILRQIVEEGIANGEIREETREMIPALILFGKGLVVDTKVTGIDAKTEIIRFLDALFGLIEIKGEK